MDNGFFRVAAVVPKLSIGDCRSNYMNIIEQCNRLYEQSVKVAVFPEMAITGYTCADLFHSSTLLDSAQECIGLLAMASTNWDMTLFVGAPIVHNNKLYNCAVAIQNGKIVGCVPKSYIPEYNEFYEKRWWRSGADVDEIVNIAGQNVSMTCRQMFEIDGVLVAAEVCEDLWTPIPPSSRAALAGAQVIVNLSASNDLIGKYQQLKSLILQQSACCMAAYVYAGAGYGESTTDVVFDGKAFIAENGSLLAESQRWSREEKVVVADIDIDAINRDRIHHSTFNDCGERELRGLEYYTISCSESNCKRNASGKLLRQVNPTPFIPLTNKEECYAEAINIQVAGLVRRLEVTHSRSLVVGISGGLDSTLALLVAVRAFDELGLDRTGIVGVTMPGFGTTDRTYNNAIKLMELLGITIKEISIVPAVKQHFADIGHDINVHDVTYENAQARERTQLLMDIANQKGGMVLGTGDLSELALGWATYNGDHMSMYGVNAGVPKTLVKHLVKWIAQDMHDDATKEILLDIVDTPISPELIPADDSGNIKQKTEDLVGPYELHDFVLYYVLRYGYSPRKIYQLERVAFEGVYDDDTIKYWLKTFFRRFFNQQFKRSCLPDGPKVASVSLSPRGDWRMPSDANSALWLEECDNL